MPIKNSANCIGQNLMKASIRVRVQMGSMGSLEPPLRQNCFIFMENFEKNQENN